MTHYAVVAMYQRLMYGNGHTFPANAFPPAAHVKVAM